MANAPTPTATAATPANAGGSNKSTPAPKVGVPAGVKKWLWLIMIAVAILIGIRIIASIARSPGQPQVVGATTQQKEVMLLSMPANGDSPRLPARVGHPVAFTGNGFTTHCVYSDGRPEGIVGDSNRPCSDGPMLHQYVHDTSGRPNMVTYEYR